MGIFYTGKGDKGKSIVGKKKIDKTSIEVEALGDLDELNSLLGIVRSSLARRSFSEGGVSNKMFKDIILSVQENLFIIQANVAVFMTPQFKPPVLKKEKITEIEKIIDDFEKKIKPARKFVISGITEESGWLDYVRAVSRRAERGVFKHSKKYKTDPAILAYLNRLSSLFFAMARMSVKMSNKIDQNPKYS